MKTLLTSAAALALCLSGASAFADHHRDHDGQERFAYDSNLYSNGWNSQYGYGYQPINTTYPLTNGGLTTQPYYSTWNNTNYGYNTLPTSGCSTCGCSTCGANNYTSYSPVVQQPQILPGGCVNYNGRTVCPTSTQYPMVRPATYNTYNNVPRSRLPFTLSGFGGQF